MAPISVYIAAEFLIFGQFKLNAKLVQQPLYGLAMDPAPNIKKLLLPGHLPMFHEFGLKPKRKVRSRRLNSPKSSASVKDWPAALTSEPG